MRHPTIGRSWPRAMVGLVLLAFLAGSMVAPLAAAAGSVRIGFSPSASQGVTPGLGDASAPRAGDRRDWGDRPHHHAFWCHPRWPCGSPAAPPRWIWNGYGWVLVPGVLVPGVLAPGVAVPGD